MYVHIYMYVCVRNNLCTFFSIGFLQKKLKKKKEKVERNILIKIISIEIIFKDMHSANKVKGVTRGESKN